MQVGEVVGNIAVARLHRLGGAVGAVEVLAPNHVLHAEFVGALQQEVSDVVAQGDALLAGRVAGNEDVQRPALGVFTERIRPEARDVLDLREPLCHCGFDGNGVMLQSGVGGPSGVRCGQRRVERRSEEEPAGDDD